MLRRSQPLRRTSLPRPTLEQVQEYEARQRANRRAHPIPLIGRKARRERADLDRFRKALRDRSRGLCEGPLGGMVIDDDGTERAVIVDHDHEWNRVAGHLGRDAHHLFPEDRGRGVHDPARGMFLCRPAHDWVDAHPTDAHGLGMLRPDAEPR